MNDEITEQYLEKVVKEIDELEKLYQRGTIKDFSSAKRNSKYDMEDKYELMAAKEIRKAMKERCMMEADSLDVILEANLKPEKQVQEFGNICFMKMVEMGKISPNNLIPYAEQVENINIVLD